MGRPKLPAGEAKSERIIVRVTPGELAALERSAAIRKTTASEIVRKAVEREISRPGRPAINPTKKG